MSPARRRADQLPFFAAVAYTAHPLLGHGAIFFPVVAKGGVERYGGVANSLSGPPSPGQLALPAALGTRWSPCRRPSRDAQTEDLRSPTSTGLGRGVAAPFARRRPNRECALTRREPADNKTLRPQRPHAHGRAPLPLLPPPCYHPPEGALAVASCAPHVHQPPQPSTVGPDSCYSPMLLSFAAYTLRCRSNGGGRP